MRAWVLVLDEVQRGENGVQAIRGLGQLWGAARAPQGVADQGDVRPHIQKLRHRATTKWLVRIYIAWSVCVDISAACLLVWYLW